jgi:hypothetical protein
MRFTPSAGAVIILVATAAACGATDVCHVDSDCATPHVCIANVCQNAPSDAGNPQEGLDSGSHDAGPGDSGHPDSGAPDSGLPDAGPLTIDEFNQQELSTLCQMLLNCVGLADAGDTSDCLNAANQNATSYLNTPTLVAEAVDAGKTTFNPGAAPACLAALKAEQCGHLSWGTWLLPEACDDLFTGTVPADGPCAADVECVSGTFCQPGHLDGGCGTCLPINPLCDQDWQCPSGKTCNPIDQFDPEVGNECGTPPTLAGQGEPCSQVRCEDGYYCDTDLSDPVCLALGQNGDACPWGGPPTSCAYGLTCVPGPSGNEYNGTCLPWKALGQYCENEFQCFGFADVLCDLSSHTCVDAPSSGPCLDGDTYSGCNSATSYCDTSGASPTCTHFIVDGDTCPTNQPGVCDPNSSCVPNSSGSFQGTCVPNAPAPVCMP